MQFNEVKVKAVDKSVSQLRASMTNQTDTRSAAASRLSATTMNQGDAPSGAGTAPVKPVLELLSQALANKLQGQEALRSLEGRKDCFVAFVDEKMALVPAEVVTSIFQDLQTKCIVNVVNTMHASPREFWVLLSTLLPVILLRTTCVLAHLTKKDPPLGSGCKSCGRKGRSAGGFSELYWYESRRKRSARDMGNVC
jgi:hypothetical protein